MFEREAALPTRLAAAVAAAVAAVFIALGLTGPWRALELKGFDALTVFTAPQRSTLPITIVGIDEPSFAAIGTQWPWPRRVHAKLVDNLVKSGALVIAFDVVFSEQDRGGPAEDQAFADAIFRAGNVVIASDMAYQETAHARQWIRRDPIALLKEAGAANGLANVSLDADLVLRDLPQGADVFWREIVKVASQRIPDIRAGEPAAGSRIRYVGADHTFPYISYYQALEAETHLPPGAFRDQIVIVGFNVKATVDARAAQSDLFFTPFTAWTGGVTPGAEIHANVLETAILGNAVATAAPHWTALLTLAVVAATALLMRRWRPLVGAAFLAALVAAMAWASAYAFGRHHLWVPAAGAAAAAVAVYLCFGALAFLSERQRKAEMRRAFSLYVSPEVVEHVMAHPERLKLGGEHREITVMFTDLKGFTNLTELLGAEQVAQVLNRHFSRATAIVKRNHGTVNRFIGDAVMAMWGAPVDDPRQADHAVRCALELQEDMELQRRELREQGLPEISMRIGIHTAVAIVGNLGSSDRFDYTAIGDGVNLAARLEPVNKLYGTGILLSGATAARLADPVGLRPVDRVIVKGQTVPVDLFTPCADPIACDLSCQAMEAYRERRFGDSAALWRRVQERLPDDGVAALQLERLEALRAVAPGPGWRDAVELEKL